MTSDSNPTVGEVPLTSSVGTASDAAPTLLAPEQLMALLPQFDQVQLIGRGGMGIVYRARQKNLDRVVAIKVLVPDIAGTSGFSERFAREARAMARLSHPNIVVVHDFGSVDNAGVQFFYLTMEHVGGSNLRSLIKKIKPANALAIVPQICEALQYAHDVGVIHRDIKPENILVDTRGRVKIADFGLAKLLQHSRSPGDYTLTRADAAMGTPSYMAPEQMERPSEVDHRADLYSLGVVLYEMLTGDLPRGRFPLPSQRVQVDVRLDEVVLKAMEHDPNRRYQHASDVQTSVEMVRSTPLRTGIKLSEPRPASARRGARLSRPALLSSCLLALEMVLLLTSRMILITYPSASFEVVVASVIYSVLIGVATSAIGIFSVMSIRDSPKENYGIRLALFTTLFFPLAVTDYLIVAVALGISEVAGSNIVLTPAALGLVFLGCLPLDLLAYWILLRKFEVDRSAGGPDSH